MSEELCVPMPYIEEELQIQCRGENGRYGVLRQTEQGTYITNILLADYSEYDRANQIYEKYIPDISARLKATVEKYQEELLSFPYLWPPKDLATVLWTVIPRAIRNFEENICTLLKTRYFADFLEPDRPYSCVAVAYGMNGAAAPDRMFCGCDTTCADAVGGYKSVYVENIYGSRLDRHFSYGHNLSQDARLLMVLRAIDGLSIDSLTTAEKELAAKCIECGYLCRQGDVLAPAILILRSDDFEPFWTLHNRLLENLQNIMEEIAAQLAGFMKEQIPAHLSGEYRSYVRCIASERFLPKLIEECIRTGLLDTPENRLSNRGVLMSVKK